MKKFYIAIALTSMCLLAGCGSSANGAADNSESTLAEAGAGASEDQSEESGVTSVNIEADDITVSGTELTGEISEDDIRSAYAKLANAIAANSEDDMKAASEDGLSDMTISELTYYISYFSEDEDINLEIMKEYDDGVIARLTNSLLNEGGNRIDIGFILEDGNLVFSPSFYQDHTCSTCSGKGVVTDSTTSDTESVNSDAGTSETSESAETADDSSVSSESASSIKKSICPDCDGVGYI